MYFLKDKQQKVKKRKTEKRARRQLNSVNGSDTDSITKDLTRYPTPVK